MLIHAFRRKEAVTVDTGAGEVDFVPNAAGDVVAEVDDDDAAGVLLAIPEGYRPYNAAATEKPSKTVKQAPPAGTGSTDANKDAPSPFLMKGADGEPDLDLATLDDEALKAFAKANAVPMHHTWKGDKLRQKIFDAFAPE